MTSPDLRGAAVDRLPVDARRGRGGAAAATWRTCSPTGRRRTSAVVLHEKSRRLRQQRRALMPGSRPRPSAPASASFAGHKVTRVPTRSAPARWRRSRPTQGRHRVRAGRRSPSAPGCAHFWEHARAARDDVDVKGRDGKVYERPTWTYWCLQEGTLKLDPDYPPSPTRARCRRCIHVDTDAAALR